MMLDPQTGRFVHLKWGEHIWMYRGHRCEIKLDASDDDGTVKAWHYVDKEFVKISPYSQTRKDVEKYIDENY